MMLLAMLSSSPFKQSSSFSSARYFSIILRIFTLRRHRVNCIYKTSQYYHHYHRTNQQNKEVQNIFKGQDENRRPHFSCFCRTTSPRCPIPIWQNDRRQYQSGQIRIHLLRNRQSLPSIAVLFEYERHGSYFMTHSLWFDININESDSNYKTIKRSRRCCGWQLARLRLLV